MEQDVVGQEDAYGATGSSPCPPTIQLPSTVQEVLAARLDRLPPAEKALLQTLAVIGRAVLGRLLAQVVGQPEEALYQPLGALQAAEFLYEQPAGSERAYRFKHVLTQEVTYASLAQERRWRLHERTAQALEALYAERLEEHYGALAHHYRHSGNTAKAVTYLQRAGGQAVQRSAYVEAVQHLATGVEILRALPDTPGRARQELDMVITLGEAVRMTQGKRRDEAELYRIKGERRRRQAVPDVHQAEACFQPALAIARRQQAKSWELRAAMSLARLWQRQGKRAEARELLAEIYGWFTEGFDTADLQDARALLEDLS